MKVLVADDSRVSRMSLSAFLLQMGHEVFIAEDGGEAAELWKKERPSFVLTDWNMPGMDGPSLIQYIRANDQNMYTYIILITMRDEVRDLLGGFEAGADDYMTKPVNRQELILRMGAGERLLNCNRAICLSLRWPDWLKRVTEKQENTLREFVDIVRNWQKNWPCI